MSYISRNEYSSVNSVMKYIEKRHISAPHQERSNFDSKRSCHMHLIESPAFHLKAVIPVIVDFSIASRQSYLVQSK